MTIEQFDLCLSKLNDLRHNIVEAKRPEYTEGNIDILNNFKSVAQELGIEPIQIWYVYFRKHVMSIGQFCADPKRKLSEPIDTRIADAINYLELLYGLLHETNSSK